MADGRGGNQPPARPAPASGPGALSRRTDGGPGQPVREAPSQGYGQGVASVAQQQGAPMRAGGPASPSAAPTGAVGAPAVGSPMPSVFGPTERPGEAITSGIPMGPGSPGPQQGPLDDVLDRLRALYLADPDNPHLAMILEAPE